MNIKNFGCESRFILVVYLHNRKIKRELTETNMICLKFLYHTEAIEKETAGSEDISNFKRRTASYDIYTSF